MPSRGIQHPHRRYQYLDIDISSPLRQTWTRFKFEYACVGCIAKHINIGLLINTLHCTKLLKYSVSHFYVRPLYKTIHNYVGALVLVLSDAY